MSERALITKETKSLPFERYAMIRLNDDLRNQFGFEFAFYDAIVGRGEYLFGRSSICVRLISFDGSYFSIAINDGLSLEVVDRTQSSFRDKFQYAVGDKIVFDISEDSINSKYRFLNGWTGTVEYLVSMKARDVEICIDEYTCYVALSVDDIKMKDEGYSAPQKPFVRRCDHCDSLYGGDIDEIYSLPTQDIGLCEECRKREFITQYHSMTPELVFYGNSEDDLYYGVEIEVDGGGELDEFAGEVVRRFNSNGRFVWASHDGSLNRGFEIITMPSTLDYHKKMKSKYKDVFQYLVAKGYRGHNTTTAGIHVHFSRNFYSENEELYATHLLRLVDKFWNQIIVFARRDYNKCSRYMKKPDQNETSFFCNWNRYDDHEGHYYAVNLTNEDTIELRMFKSTLNVDSFMCILEFVDRLIRTAKSASLAEIEKMSFEELLTKNCAEYYKTRCDMKKFEEC